MNNHRSRREFWERISNGLLYLVVGLFVGSAILSVTGFPDSPTVSRLAAQVNGALPERTAAVESAPAWYDKVWTQVGSVLAVVGETRDRVMAGDMFRITQIGAASATAVQDALENDLPTPGIYMAGTALQPARDPIDGTLLINTPLQVANSLSVQGTSTFATTTVNGALSATAAAFGAASVDGTLTAGGVSAGAIDATGVTAGSVGADTVTGTTVDAGTVTTDNLNVTTLVNFAALEVSGSSQFNTVSIASTTAVAGVVRALGGLTTEGADIDLGEGELFAANVVNEVVAGDNVSVTGTRNQPIISVDTDDLVGVLSIDGESGEVELEEGIDIRINDLRISNTSRLSSVRARGGCSNCITDGDTRNDLTISGGLIENTAIGSSSPSTGRFTTLRVGSSTATSAPLVVESNATSTFVGSIDISSGCFAIGGTCIGGVAATEYIQLNDTPGSLLAGALQYANATGSALIQSAELVFQNGNFGIGTSTPEERLSVVGTTTIDGTLQVQSATSSQFSGGINVTNGCVAVDGACIGGITSIDGLTDVSVASSTDGDLFSFDGSAWRNVATSTLGLGDGTFIGLNDTPSGYTANALLYANSAGTSLVQAADFVFDGSRLAIGTSSPRTTLTVGGDVSVLGRAAVRYYDETNGEYVALRAPSGLATSTTWNLPASDGTSDQLLVTDGNGNLRFDDVSSIGGGANSYLELLDTPSSYLAGGLQFANASGTALVQNSDFVFQNGFLGVGVDTPTERLVTDGTVRFLGGGGSTGFVYDRSTNRVGVGASSPTDRFTVQGGSILQRGGSASEQYTPSLLGGLPLPANANDIKKRGSYVYAVTDSTGDDFHVIDVSDISNPAEVGSLEMGASTRGVDIQGQYAYITTTISGDDFHVIDISDPGNPVEVAAIDLPTSATDVVVRGRYAYVGTASGGDDFHVIDISNPLVPQEVGSIDLADTVNDIVVAGDYAYVATAIQGDDFHVVDISDPSNPVEVGSINLPENANGVSVRGNTAYVVTSGSAQNFFIIDVSDRTAPNTLGSTSLVTSLLSIVITGQYAYVTSAASNEDFHVVDVLDPTDPVEIGATDIGAGNVFGVAISGKYAYAVSADSGDGLHILDVSGANLQSAIVQSLEVGGLTIQGDTLVSGRLVTELGIRAGNEGIQSDGELNVSSSGTSSIMGWLSIGTSTANTELTVDGTIQATNLLGGAVSLSTDANGNIIRDPSDRRLKADIATIEDALDIVLNLQGVRYRWQDPERFGPQTEVGFIAQDVYPYLPEVVRTGGDYWSLNTRNITAVIVESIKEIWQTVRGNQERIQTLEERVQILEAELHSTAPTASSSANDTSTNTATNDDADDTGASDNEPDTVEEADTDTAKTSAVMDSATSTTATTTSTADTTTATSSATSTAPDEAVATTTSAASTTATSSLQVNDTGGAITTNPATSTAADAADTVTNTEEPDPVANTADTADSSPGMASTTDADG